VYRIARRCRLRLPAPQKTIGRVEIIEFFAVLTPALTPPLAETCDLPAKSHCIHLNRAGFAKPRRMREIDRTGFVTSSRMTGTSWVGATLYRVSQSTSSAAEKNSLSISVFSREAVAAAHKQKYKSPRTYKYHDGGQPSRGPDFGRWFVFPERGQEIGTRRCCCVSFLSLNLLACGWPSAIRRCPPQQRCRQKPPTESVPS
jgi:hypothetical protein